MSNIDWDNAPEGSEFYADGCFWRDGDVRWFPTSRTWQGSVITDAEMYSDYCERPQTQQNTSEIAQESSNRYTRKIVGLDGKTCQIDVYRVLVAFEVDSHPVAHAIKKLLAPGMRHAKTREQDLKEAIASIEAELLMMEHQEELLKNDVLKQER